MKGFKCVLFSYGTEFWAKCWMKWIITETELGWSSVCGQQGQDVPCTSHNAPVRVHTHMHTQCWQLKTSRVFSLGWREEVGVWNWRRAGRSKTGNVNQTSGGIQSNEDQSIKGKCGVRVCECVSVCVWECVCVGCFLCSACKHKVSIPSKTREQSYICFTHRDFKTSPFAVYISLRQQNRCNCSLRTLAKVSKLSDKNSLV